MIGQDYWQRDSDKREKTLKVNLAILHKKIILWIVTPILIISSFWYYNFRFVEFTPLRSNYRELPNHESWIVRKDLWKNASKEKRTCLKDTLEMFRQDYREVNNVLFVRAFVQRDKNSVGTYTRQLKEPCPRDKHGIISSLEQRQGFFQRYLPYNNNINKIAELLDKLFMWNK